MATLPEALAVALKHHQAGRLQAAEQIYRQVLQADPNQADAIHLLGMIAYAGRRFDLAIELIGRAIQLNNRAAAYHSNLANIYRDQQRLPEAIVSYHRAIALQPDFAEAHNNLGNALQEQGRLPEAIASFGRALELKPTFAEAHHNLGLTFKEQGKLEAAVACDRRALELKPDFPEAFNNLGIVLAEQGKVDEAVLCFQRALELNPSAVETHNNLGNAFKDQGRLDEAIACYRRALALNPGFVKAGSNLVYLQLFQPGWTAQALLQEHLRWHELHAAPLVHAILPHPNDRSPLRRLRVGYVSPNLRDHVVGRNLLPLFREHDHTQFEIFCYSDAVRTDELTRRFQSGADVWRDTFGLSHEHLTARIREDQIDILVDLSLHLAGSRLLLFARQPAPVQVTFAGYPGTTGLSTIAYRLTDPRLDPPGLFDDCYSEKSIRLPYSFWCYEPAGSEPPVNPLPATEKGYITFGCLNNFCKVNPGMLKLWASLLKTVDQSRLMLLAGEGRHRHETLSLLTAEGIDSARVTFIPHQPRHAYLSHYHDIDIGLDTVPYNGHTTSLDSLWMGVPVVTLVGSTVVGRAGLSQLTSLGLPELIATSPEQYLQIAAALAQDLPRLSTLRSTLRGRMQASPLTDAPRFARNIETAYRQMWKHWCK